MPELRQDPVSQRWVIIATERAKRPSDFIHPQETKRGPDNCPFCAGKEKETPPEVLAFRDPDTAADTPGWKVRVVPNKFAALRPEGELQSKEQGIYRTLSGVGAHEVIIEHPEHHLFFPDYTTEHAALVLKAWRQRYLQLGQNPKLKYVQIFKNHGQIAGASLEHPHSQLIATPQVPAAVRAEMRRAQNYQDWRGRCIYCDILQAEETNGSRIIALNDNFLAFCPFASRFPFETWILPRNHQPTFGMVDDEQLSDLAFILKEVLGRLKRAVNDPPYNLILHTSPLREEEPAYHWHLELLPRLTIVAGFEWGTDMYINPTPPEAAVRFLLETPGPEEVETNG
ncbi:MAG: UDPglucose--hexose-phosphate uridylyltransferase [Clostridia bacterium]|nr:UDPglucose--hexose-phosphate uridylyltransferase [Clostridia bacterium]